MKELSIEEKAKAYDKVIKRANELLYVSDKDSLQRKTVEHIFPELKELEDEKIRKEMLQELKDSEDSIILTPLKRKRWISWLEKQKAIDILDEEEREFADNVDSYRKEIDAAYQTGYNEGVKATLENQGEQVYDENLSKLLNKVICRFINDPNIPYSERDEVSKKIIPYVERLENQGEQKTIKEHNVCDFCEEKASCIDPCPMKLVEQKPAEWSEEDNKIIKEIINDIECARAVNYHASKEGYEFRENWLKSIKDRVQPQPKQEWSEEDERMLDEMYEFFDKHKVPSLKHRMNDYAKFIKSLRPRNTWKPSDEQLDALHDAAVYVDKSMFPYPKGILMKLYKQLKKLREE